MGSNPTLVTISFCILVLFFFFLAGVEEQVSAGQKRRVLWNGELFPHSMSFILPGLMRVLRPFVAVVSRHREEGLFCAGVSLRSRPAYDY